MLLIEVEEILVPITIFFKGDRENIDAKELEAHLREVTEELGKVRRLEQRPFKG